jgi:hypothetical protein
LGWEMVRRRKNIKIEKGGGNEKKYDRIDE